MTLASAPLLLFASLCGLYFAYLYGKNTKQFRWREYIAMLVVPVMGCLSLSYIYGVKIIQLFVASAVLGFALEYTLGLAYHKTLNKHLWYYSRLRVGDGYTSFLTLPMWGVGGIAFWLLAHSIGL